MVWKQNIKGDAQSLLTFNFFPLNFPRADIPGSCEAMIVHQVSCTLSTPQLSLAHSEGAGGGGAEVGRWFLGLGEERGF